LYTFSAKARFVLLLMETARTSAFSRYQSKPNNVII
jgi:hypothetical protein